VYDRNNIAQDKNPPWPAISPWPQTPAPNTPGGPPSSPPPVFTYLWDGTGQPQANYPGTINAVGTGGGGAVTSVQGRTGAVTLIPADLASMGGAPLASPALTGSPTGPTAVLGDSSGRLATTSFVSLAIANFTAVQSFNARSGAVVLTLADVINAGGAPNASPSFTGNPTAPTPAAADASQSIATTAFVSTALASGTVQSWNGRRGAVTLTLSDVLSVGAAPLASPAFTGTPTAPTPAAHDGSTKLATTAYVDNAVTASTGGVSSFNTRSGAVTLLTSDITGAGGAPIVSPALTGTPTAPTQGAADNSTKLATTAFVAAALATGAVQTFNGRSGAVVLSNADIVGAGGAPIASPALTGNPTAPTPTAGDNDTSIATTAFVTGAVAALNISNYLPLAGGTLTGNLAIAPAAGGVLLTLNGVAGTGRQIYGQTAGSNRWQLHLGDNTAEGGSNAGSNLLINRHSDAGAYIDTPLAINRATGLVSIGPGPANSTVFASGNATLSLNKTGTSPASLIGTSAGLTRWNLQVGNSAAESSGNVGSDFVLTRYNDAGATIDAPLSINRASGGVTLTGGLVVPGATTIGPAASGNSAITLNKTSGAFSNFINFGTAGSTRWQIVGGDATAEGGSNAGSNFSLNALSDAAAQLGPAFSIVRSTQVVTFGKAIVNGPSDRTLKENIRPIDPAEALSDVLQLQPVRFNMIDDASKRAQIGLIAQDVAPVVPEVLQNYQPDPDADPKLALDYSRLVATLIGAVQALTARVAVLEAKA
jgi:Chaperone of endosialidase